MAMLIPSIDLMGGKIVQLVQGERKALEFEDFEEVDRALLLFPLVQLIDLDAAIGTRSQSGPGARVCPPPSVSGRRRSALDRNCGANAVDRRAARDPRIIAHPRWSARHCVCGRGSQRAVGPEKLVFAIDSKQGRVAIRGWRELTAITPLEMIAALERWCGAFLYTHIDTEGLMQGIPLDTVSQLRGCNQEAVDRGWWHCEL